MSLPDDILAFLISKIHEFQENQENIENTRATGRQPSMDSPALLPKQTSAASDKPDYSRKHTPGRLAGQASVVQDSIGVDTPTSQTGQPDQLVDMQPMQTPATRSSLQGTSDESGQIIHNSTNQNQVETLTDANRMVIPISEISIHLPSFPEKEPLQTEADLDQVIIQNYQNMTNQAAAHDTRLLAKYWGDEVSDQEEEAFTPVVTKKMTRNMNRTYNIRQRRKLMR